MGVTMFSTFRTTAIGAAALAVAQLTAPAQAAYVVTLLEVPAGGGITNVVATGSGPIDLTDLTSHPFVISAQAGEHAGIAEINTGPASQADTDTYIGFTGPNSFGSGALFFANSGSGDIVSILGSGAIVGESPFLLVPKGYVSGNPLSDTSTYDNQTFASLGVTPGTYEWPWGTGAHADSFTLQIGAAPEPASLPLLALGLAGLGVALRARRA